MKYIDNSLIIPVFLYKFIIHIKIKESQCQK